MTALTWTVHPAARRRAATLATLALVALTAVTAARIGQGAGWGIVAAAFLTVSVSSFLFPTRYHLDERGIEVRHLGSVRRRTWRDVRRVDQVPGGLLLSPYIRPTLRDRFRAVLIRTEERDRQGVLGFVEAHRG
jgi:hypothetical protein